MAIKFISNRASLLSLIIPALAATSTKSTLPALEGLLFSLEDNLLTVCGYDLEKGVKTSAPVYPKEDGAVILNAQKISAIIRNFPDCEIHFEADEKNVVRISGAMSDFSIHGLAAEAFPNLPELGGDKSFSISQSLLKDIIATTHFAVAQTDARPILTGELFKIDGKNLTVVALDNYRLALREETNAIFGNDSSYSFVVPGKTLIEFSKLLDESEEMVVVEFTSKYIIFKVRDIIFFSRLLEGEFLDYNRAIPNQNKIFVKVNTADFIESASRAALLVDEKLKTPLKCKFSGDILDISCSTQYGKVNDNIKIQKDGDDIEIGFNSRYLLDALRACRDDYINAAMSTPLMSMVITPSKKKDNSKYTYLVLPCRIKE
ncbi:MAG: DNA polymerase III subunit beta [Firmicutes bacterium HGW-Firmicutes-21]|nr:MAG: DNA polymerase III subunit beta [Firmicutes bacterium HGW-Firmicutes-21]